MNNKLRFLLLPVMGVLFVTGNAQGSSFYDPNSPANRLWAYQQEQARIAEQQKQAQAISQLKTEQENLRRQLELQAQLKTISTPYVPLPVYHYNTYVPTYNPTYSYKSEVPVVVPKVASAQTCKVQFKNVPALVADSFKKIYNRDIVALESTYWKKRLRTDKCTIEELEKTMAHYFSAGKIPYGLNKPVMLKK